MSDLRRVVGGLLVLLVCGLTAASALGFAAAAGATTFSRVATLAHDASALATGASADGHQVLIVADPPSLEFFVPPQNKRPLFLASPSSATPRTIDRGFDQDSSVSSNGRYIAWVNHNCSDVHSAHAFVQSTRAGARPRELTIPKRYSRNDITSIVVSPYGRVTVLSLANDQSEAACLNAYGGNAILSAAPGSRRFDIIARASATSLGDHAVSPDGSTFALCGSTVVAVQATPRLRSARGHAGVGIGPAAGCAASDAGTATEVEYTSTLLTRLITVGLGHTRRVDVKPELNGLAVAINPTGTRAVIAADDAGRLVVVDLLDGQARTLPKPGFLAHAPGALFSVAAPLTWSKANTVAGIVTAHNSFDGFLVNLKTGDWSRPLREPIDHLSYCSDRSGTVLWTIGPGFGFLDQRFDVTAPDSLRFTAIDNRLGAITNLSCPAGQGRVFLTTGAATGLGPVNVDATPLGALDGSPWTAGR